MQRKAERLVSLLLLLVKCICLKTGEALRTWRATLPPAHEHVALAEGRIISVEQAASAEAAAAGDGRDA